MQVVPDICTGLRGKHEHVFRQRKLLRQADHIFGRSAAPVQHAIFNMPNLDEIAPLEIFGREVIPAVTGF